MGTNTDKKIKGGYYIKARCIQESEIATAPPHVREIWDWLLKEANHADRKVSSKIIKRGQCFTSYKDIRDGLKWKVGYRWERYSKNDVQTAMRYLLKHTMAHTTKSTRGMIVTILNYDRYQNPANYETYNETHTRHTMNIHDKQELKELNNIYSTEFTLIWKEYPNRIGKRKALQAFKETVRTEEDLGKIKAALAKYRAHLRANGWKKPQNGSTWFNNWQEWVDYEEPGPKKAKIYAV